MSFASLSEAMTGARVRDAERHLPEPGTSLADGDLRVTVYATAKLPTRFGDFDVVVFRTNRDSLEHVALVHGDVRGVAGVYSRIHSECLTGDVFGSLRCDCRDQLEAALRELALVPVGVILYMRQEGRGIGLGNKIRAYALQEQGLDTVDANRHLGFDDDLRRYDVSALMYRLLGIDSVALATNNPRKIGSIRQHGIVVSRRLPIVMPHNPYNEGYLRTKAQRSGHLLPVID